jgi:nucleobase:cation symporter-1, NCS1 family
MIQPRAATADPGTPHRAEGMHFAPDPRLYNADLAPTEPIRRTWTTYNYLALWFSMSMEVTTYMLASSLIAGGMNWRQAVFTILLGNLIVLIPMLLNAHAGTKYGIPFPVFVRASFGPVGANIPAVLRAVVACGWFGIQSWIGGQAIAQMVNVLAPSGAAWSPSGSCRATRCRSCWCFPACCSFS